MPAQLVRARKILFAYEFCGLGGVETSTLAKLDALERVGVEAWAYFARFYGEGGRDLAKHPRVIIGMMPDRGLAALLRQGWDALSLIDYPALLPLLDGAPADLPVIFEAHSALPAWQDRAIAQLRDRRLSAITVPSSYNARLMRGRLGDDARVVVAPNPVDTVAFAPAGSAAVPFSPLDPGERPVLWIGRLEDEKNPQELLRIADRLLETGAPVRFYVVGDAPGRYEEWRQLLESQMSDRTRASFTFEQHIAAAKMPALYRWVARHGGVLISTSQHESLPMTFLEAMASGCAVLSSDVGGVRDLIRDGETGWLYPLGEVESAVDLLSVVLGQDGRSHHRHVALHARSMVLARHSKAAVGDWYERFLAGLWRTAPRRGDESISELAAGIDKGAAVPGLVSTIIPVYNRAGLLRQAVASVQAQTYRPIEIIIVDDGSDDGTAQVCDQLAEVDPEIHVVHEPHHGRAGPVREAGRLVAKGEFIQYLDSDDLLMPTKFEVMVPALDGEFGRDIAYCYTRRYGVGELPVDSAVERTGESHDQMYPAFLSQRFWHTSTPLYRRRITDAAGPWTDLRAWEDIEYDMRIAALDPRLYHCREYLVDFRDHPFGRLSRGGNWLGDREMLTEAARAYSLIADHARLAGLAPSAMEVRDLVGDLSFLVVQCRQLGLAAAEALLTNSIETLTGESVIAPIERPILRAELSVDRKSLSGSPGSVQAVRVEVTNRSSISLRRSVTPICLSYHLLTADGEVVRWDNDRVQFSPPIAPGQCRSLEVAVILPPRRGTYALELDLVMEQIAWFKQLGNPVVTLPVEVLPRLAAADSEAPAVEAAAKSGSWPRATYKAAISRSLARLAIRLPAPLAGLVWRNPLLDVGWYRDRYPDVDVARVEPNWHYRRHGLSEGRNPNRLFDSAWYLQRNPDVAERSMDPLDHFYLYGAREGRNPSPRFDTSWYLATNDDVRRSGVNPLLHFLRFGSAEGRAPRPANNCENDEPVTEAIERR